MAASIFLGHQYDGFITDPEDSLESMIQIILLNNNSEKMEVWKGLNEKQKRNKRKISTEPKERMVKRKKVSKEPEKKK